MDTSEITQLTEALLKANVQLTAAHTAQAQVEASVTDLERFADRIASLSAKLGMAQESYDRVRALTEQSAALDAALAARQKDIEWADARVLELHTEIEQRTEELAALEKTLAAREHKLAETEAAFAAIKARFDRFATTEGMP